MFLLFGILSCRYFIKIYSLCVQLYDCIQQMRSCSGSLSNHQEVLIKRYYEIHFDYSTEFKNTSVGKVYVFYITVQFKTCTCM
jgi:hypothetical protein